MAAERIDIIISERGARTVQKSIRGVKDEANATGKAVDQLKSALQFAGIGLSVAALVTFTDTATEIRNVLKGATNNTIEFEQALKGVQNIGTTTGTSIKALAELYDTLSTAGKDFKATQEQTLGITDTIAKAFAAEGKSAGEATGAINALSRSLLKGETDMRGFISILNQSNLLAEALASQFGMTAGEFVRMIEAGKVSSEDLFKALLQSQGIIQSAFDNTSRTIGQSFTMLQGSIITLVDNFEQMTGAFSFVASVVGVLARNIELLIPLLAALATSWLLRVTQAMFLLRTAILAVNAAWFISPWGVVAAGLAAITAAVFAAYYAWDDFRNVVNDVLVSLGLMEKATADAQRRSGELAAKADAAAEATHRLALTGAGAADSANDLAGAAGRAGAALDDLGASSDKAGRATQSTGNFYLDFLQTVNETSAASVQFGDRIAQNTAQFQIAERGARSYASALNEISQKYREISAMKISPVSFDNGRIGGSSGKRSTFSFDTAADLLEKLKSGQLSGNMFADFEKLWPGGARGPVGTMLANNYNKALEMFRQEMANQSAEMTRSTQAQRLAGVNTTNPTVSPQTVQNNKTAKVDVTIITQDAQSFGKSRAQVQRDIGFAVQGAFQQI